MFGKKYHGLRFVIHVPTLMSAPCTSKANIVKKVFVIDLYEEKVKAFLTIVAVKGKANAPSKVKCTPSTTKAKNKVSLNCQGRENSRR